MDIKEAIQELAKQIPNANQVQTELLQTKVEALERLARLETETK